MSDQSRPRAVVLLGGLDSATCAAQAITDGYEAIALSFDYGQRHDKELTAARELVETFGIAEHQIVKTNLSQWGGSSLTDRTMALPTEGKDLGSKEIPSTYVPGRNTVFIAIALSLAEARGAIAIFSSLVTIRSPCFSKPQAPWILGYVAVIAKARGQGVGKFLLRSLLDQARQKDQLHVGIMVINGNDCAHKAYESMGFKPYETLYADYFDNNFGIEFSGFIKFGQILAPVV